MFKKVATNSPESPMLWVTYSSYVAAVIVCHVHKNYKKSHKSYEKLKRIQIPLDMLYASISVPYF
jgi:hypothetical protein